LFSKCKIAGVPFTKGIQEEVFLVPKREERKLDDKELVLTLTMAHNSRTMLMSLPTARKIRNTADIEAFVAKTVRKILKSRMACSFLGEGYSNLMRRVLLQILCN
jgi:hypothetical protein